MAPTELPPDPLDGTFGLKTPVDGVRTEAELRGVVLSDRCRVGLVEPRDRRVWGSDVDGT